MMKAGHFTILLALMLFKVMHNRKDNDATKKRIHLIFSSNKLCKYIGKANILNPTFIPNKL